MKIKISEDVKKITKKCDTSFICLEDKEKIYCSVEYFMDNKGHIFKCLHNDTCNYKMSVGNLFVCKCHVRKEIFNKFKV